jgi:hypothetical protein
MKVFVSIEQGTNNSAILVRTFFHRGARNSFRVMPISPYVMGKIQNPHLNQGGKEAARTKL